MARPINATTGRSAATIASPGSGRAKPKASTIRWRDSNGRPTSVASSAWVRGPRAAQRSKGQLSMKAKDRCPARMALAMPSIGRPPSSHARATRIFRTSTARKGATRPWRGTRTPWVTSRWISSIPTPGLAASSAPDSSSDDGAIAPGSPLITTTS